MSRGYNCKSRVSELPILVTSCFFVMQLQMNNYCLSVGGTGWVIDSSLLHSRRRLDSHKNDHQMSKKMPLNKLLTFHLYEAVGILYTLKLIWTSTLFSPTALRGHAKAIRPPDWSPTSQSATTDPPGCVFPIFPLPPSCFFVFQFFHFPGTPLATLASPVCPE